MSDRIKGVLVNFEYNLTDEQVQVLMNALHMFKGVLTVKPYIAGMEDYMMYQRGYYDAKKSMIECLRNEPLNPKE